MSVTELLADVRRDPQNFVILVFGGLVILLGGYTVYGKVTTNWTCLDNGYPTVRWTLITGGMCSKVENGNTVLVKVRDLKFSR